MNCPTCDYEFDPTRSLACPRCGEPFDCSAVDCGTCGACTRPLASLGRRLLPNVSGVAEARSEEVVDRPIPLERLEGQGVQLETSRGEKAKTDGPEHVRDDE